MKIKDLILKLQQLDQEQDLHFYEGVAQEFTSDCGWECTNMDDTGIQVFFPEEVG